jgi:hypothetical protein
MHSEEHLSWVGFQVRSKNHRPSQIPRHHFPHEDSAPTRVVPLLVHQQCLTVGVRGGSQARVGARALERQQRHARSNNGRAALSFPHVPFLQGVASAGETVHYTVYLSPFLWVRTPGHQTV